MIVIKKVNALHICDANNLYGWAMSQYLSYSKIEWLNKKEINGICFNSIEENSSIGYILEVDLNYPDAFHELHNNYPLAPGKIEISQNMLSKHGSNKQLQNKYTFFSKLQQATSAIFFQLCLSFLEEIENAKKEKMNSALNKMNGDRKFLAITYHFILCVREVVVGTPSPTIVWLK